ncbi:MAG: type II secretion system F family protein [Capsulimonadaceae bacterium]
MVITILITALAFTFGMLLVVGLTAPVHDKTILNQRIDTIARSLDTDYETMPSLTDAEMNASFGDRVVRPALRRMSTLSTKLTPAGATDEIRAMLVRAGNPGHLGVTEFIGLKVVSLLVMLCLGIVMQHVLASDIATRLGIVMLFTLIGYVAPDSLLQNMITSRQYIIRKKLPDTIDLLIVSVEAGLGFDQAISKVVEKMKGPIAEEFGRVLDEMRLGKQRGRALRDMAARLDISEVSSFVTAIVQSEQLGVSIASVLRVQSEAIRIARAQSIRTQAAKLPVKMLIPLIFFIFPAILVVMMGPAIITIKNAFAHL